MDNAQISTVTPVFRGEQFLGDLIDELSRLRTQWEEDGLPFELVESIFVDDGSEDGSSQKLSELEREHAWVRVVFLSRNFGQHPATVAGMLHTSGDWVVTLDEDMQHPPSEIPSLLDTALTQNSDIIYASPKNAVHRSIFRDGASRISKWMTGLITGNPHVKQFNSFRLIRGNIARGAASVCGHDLYLDLALGWFTNRISQVKLVLEDKRFQAEKASGYTFRKLLGHWRRLFISSQVRLLRLGAGMGLFAILGATLYGLKIVCLKILYPSQYPFKGGPQLLWPSCFSVA